MAQHMIIPNDDSSSSQYHHHHHHHYLSIMIPQQSSQTAVSSSMQQQQQQQHPSSDNNNTFTEEQPFNNHYHNTTITPNIGVVSPLIYAPTVPSPTVRTVSSCGNIITQGGHNNFPRTGNPPTIVNHANYLNSISPASTQRIDACMVSSISNNSSNLNYNWTDFASSSNHSARSHSDHHHRTIPLAQRSLTNTTTTPKHERHISDNTATSSSCTMRWPSSTSAPILLEQYSTTTSGTKKQRPNSYIAPRHIPDTYTRRVGSYYSNNGSSNLKGSTNNNNTSTVTDNINMNGGMSGAVNHKNNNPRGVQLRRQLSSGKIEAFLSGNHNTSTTTDIGSANSMMDVDHTSNSNINSSMSHSNSNATTQEASISQQQQQQQRPRSMSF